MQNAETSHANEEYTMPCVEGLLAATMALMTGHVQDCCLAHREAMACKIVSNLNALLDEPRVLDGTRGIQHHLDAACATEAPDIEHVLHTHRLPAGEVDRHRDADVGNPFGANLPHQRIELSDVDVALERMR